MTTIVQKTQSQTLGEKAMSLAERLKAEGHEEGQTEGLEKGELIGEIRFAQKMLKQSQSSKEELFQKTLEELKEILLQLEQQLSI